LTNRRTRESFLSAADHTVGRPYCTSFDSTKQEPTLSLLNLLSLFLVTLNLPSSACVSCDSSGSRRRSSSSISNRSSPHASAKLDDNDELSAVISIAKQGPLWSKLKSALGSSAMPEAKDWLRHGEAITASLTGRRLPAVELEPSVAARVYHLYLPIYFFMRAHVQARRVAGEMNALAVGLSAPQGCGKTTLVDLMIERFADDGLTCVAVSIDDFYLSGAEQDKLAAAHPTNPLFQVRGNAGTHDLELGASVLSALKQQQSAGVHIPRYDKAARGGRGDRAPEDKWPLVQRPPDVVLLEGWMAGFAPVSSDAAVLSQHAGLAEVNEKLGHYGQAWHDLMDTWIVIATDNLDNVYKWRLQAEKAMTATGRTGMSDAQVADFVDRYMPAYKAYLPDLLMQASGRGVGGKPTLLVHVDQTRTPIVTSPNGKLGVDDV